MKRIISKKIIFCILIILIAVIAFFVTDKYITPVSDSNLNQSSNDNPTENIGELLPPLQLNDIAIKRSVSDPIITEQEIIDAIKSSNNSSEELSMKLNDIIPESPAEGTYEFTVNAHAADGRQAYCTAKLTVTTAKSINIGTASNSSVPYSPGCESTACWDAAGIPDQPYLAAVNRSLCTVTIYGKDSAGNYRIPVKSFACSVGREGHNTIKGRFTSTERFEWRYMIDKSWGRYAIRINGKIMFHSVCYYSKSINDLEYEEFNKLGEPASLGCVRFCVADIKWIYDNCPQNFPVIIYDDETTPGPLGKPGTIKTDASNEELRGWDPTDPAEENPWKDHTDILYP